MPSTLAPRAEMSCASPAPASRSVTAAARLVKGLWAGLKKELRVRRDMRILAAMDDAALNDIGLSRTSVESAVRHGRDGLDLPAGPNVWKPSLDRSVLTDTGWR